MTKLIFPALCYTSIIGFKPRRLKAPRGDELPRDASSCQCEMFLVLLFMLLSVVCDLQWTPGGRHSNCAVPSAQGRRRT